MDLSNCMSFPTRWRQRISEIKENTVSFKKVERVLKISCLSKIQQHSPKSLRALLRVILKLIPAWSPPGIQLNLPPHNIYIIQNKCQWNKIDILGILLLYKKMLI